MGNDLVGYLGGIGGKIFQENIQAGKKELTAGKGKKLEDMTFDNHSVKK